MVDGFVKSGLQKSLDAKNSLDLSAVMQHNVGTLRGDFTSVLGEHSHAFVSAQIDTNKDWSAMAGLKLRW